MEKPVTSKQTQWAFVDLENVPRLDPIAFEQYQQIFVFVGPKQVNLNLPVQTTTRYILNIIKVSQVSQNNVDFHLAWYLGLAHEQADKTCHFTVFTNDKGLMPLVNTVKQLGRSCTLQGVIQTKQKVALSLEETKKVLKTPFFQRNNGFPKQLTGLRRCLINIVGAARAHSVEAHIANLVTLKVISYNGEALAWYLAALAKHRK
ncbi:PIN domain-containing protein [Providencia stuartii]|nr:PIN domain-containing protein [Providencia stuartii]